MSKFNIANTLTREQRIDISDKLEMLMAKHGAQIRDNMYFAGRAEGLNEAYKLINEIVDDYCIDLMENNDE